MVRSDDRPGMATQAMPGLFLFPPVGRSVGRSNGPQTGRRRAADAFGRSGPAVQTSRRIATHLRAVYAFWGRWQTLASMATACHSPTLSPCQVGGAWSLPLGMGMTLVDVSREIQSVPPGEHLGP
jgi:hypothetical protein